MLKHCERCGLSFTVKPYRKSVARFCSYDCYWNRNVDKSEKQCTKCNRLLSIKSFTKNGKSFNSHCRDCRQKEWKNWQRRNDSFNRFRFYEWNAKRNSKDFKITLDDFKRYVECGECYYCGSSERLGLDRVDSSMGYTLDNIVASCRRCNVAKSDQTKEDFIKMCSDIYKKHGTS